MEIKIGIADSNRELVVQSKDSADDVKKAVTDVFGGSSAVLALTDEKGKQYLVPAARVAYVEIGSNENRSVGFAAQ
ncbi:ATP-binding protein OS=Tsukamurella paurometabola (strain ATCC 8368 / DSM / CCUG 35730 / CIP 100753 / JCM 10117 / KCTC 9821 / NBRC 16120 / NCIMB 702349/ NCTC 13040) OX=521096 GN=Tpau_1116 PE=4 SV=1 [Tsukamurella paurometabola]|uniref:ATP-binding protein n=1 Tax=Tsukamurella paurometabola (strain ATCC 8368 / DSM 20162 / CCUG 35730 / CIP 100753 / JCM 10117 / KCTC 9821 / NBRC 16120 / NCIMB 702349 / NCTC 13040) TaxID=521096 RepID=D5UVF8_TSUPD|nr:DUF3107 domain-containing protein [Tsukamurella paurometabola]ADG77748.1 conserved hypothetical protein [Tsukamurella paurometabola DSM 20162]SUP28607.1 Protein of uncharacterised function (DUF3107) [Tsukamurella paurometabola]